MDEARGTIFNIQRFSIHDGPGIRTTVFLKGCPLICWWCHNPESHSSQRELILREERCIGCRACVDACPNQAAFLSENGPGTRPDRCALCGACVRACPSEAREFAGREVTVNEVLTEVERDSIFYEESGGGVTFSGGEPLAQPDFLCALLAGCQARWIRTAVDTSGFAAPEILDRIAPLTDLFLYDLKLMDSAKHRTYTGAPNELILENLRSLTDAGRPVTVRVPIIPGINDDDQEIARMGEFLASLRRPPPVELLAYHKTGLDKHVRLGRPYALPDLQPPSRERVHEIAERLRGFGLTVSTGD